MRGALVALVAAALTAGAVDARAQRGVDDATMASARMLELSAREQVLLDELEVIETRLLVIHTELQSLHIQEREMESHLSDLDRDLAKASADLVQRQLAVRYRVRSLYMHSERSFLQLLFSARDLRDLLMGSRYLAFVLKQDDAVLSELSDQVARTTTLRQEREQEWEQLRARIVERQAMQEEQRGLRERRGDLLHGVQGERRAAAIAAAASDRAERAMAEVTGDPPAPPPAHAPAVDLGAADRDDDDDGAATVLSTGFARNRGRLVMPVPGDVFGQFGWHTVSGTDERAFRRGIDIEAAPGTEVRAVYAGQVRRAEWIRGFGNVVILDHGDSYYSVYAHLESFGVDVGQMVSSGQVLGAAGESGSMIGPYLHFEIRHQGQPIDPLEWLQLPPGVSIR